MLADGHDVIRRGVRQLLESSCHCSIVAEARDGLEALRHADQLKPDIAIVAYALPSLNGLELFYAMRQAGLKTKVVLYTYCESPEVITSAVQAGIRGIALKSDPESSLIDAVEAVSRGRAYFSSAVSDELMRKVLASPPIVPSWGLTPRERQIVQLVAEGLTNKQIGQKLEISLKTVETHRASAQRKLKVRTTAPLVCWSIRHHLIET